MDNDQKALYTFVAIIKSFEECLKANFGTFCYPHLKREESIPMNGHIFCNGKNVKYRFHGRGCTIEWEKFSIDYDVANDANKILLSPWKFSKFYNEYVEVKVSVETVYEILQNLEKKGILISEENSSGMTFHVSEKWFDTV
ncbi:MAG: hypothetical protein KF862_18320 [Chitinophagaceae bacterium]|nr:hypothetical protein [Chitinophagaceae bacterium]